jgi:hypothetical protein
MITKITAGLLAVTLLAACETTKTTQRTTLRETNAAVTFAPSFMRTGPTQRTTLREMNAARLASAETTNLNEPAPPAEGPEDIPAEGPRDPIRNPALVPSPLLRANAAGSP